MRKYFAIAGLVAAAAIALTGCRVETAFDPVSISGSYSISASLGQDTRTTNSGMSTLWDAKDSVSVFYSTAPDVYVGGKGTITNGAKTTQATFEVEGAAPEGVADWYMLFPYKSDIETPGQRNQGWTYIGHSKGAEQNEYDSTNHLAKSLCPMYGVAKGAEAATVDITMHHLTSVIEFEVINKTGSAIDAVKSVSVTASEDIVGSYFIDITGDAPVYTMSGESFVSSTASVTVKNPAQLADGQGAKLYLPVKPFTQSQSEPLKIEVFCTVDGVAKHFEVETVPTGGQAVFSAGKIKTVQVNLTKLIDKIDSVEYAMESPSGTPVVLEGIVTSIFPKGFFVEDATGPIFVYTNAAPTVAPGSFVRIEGKTSTNSHHIQVSNSDLSITETGQASVERTPASWTGSDVEAAYEKTNNVAYVTVEGTALSAARLSVEGTETVLSIDTNHRAEGVSFSKGQKYTITGYVYGYAKNGEELQVCLYAETAVIGGGDNPGGDNPGGGGGDTPEGTLLSITMSEYIAAHNCKVGDNTCYTTLELSPSVRMSTTGAPNCGAFYGKDPNNDWRLYQNKDGNVTISVAEGCTLKLVQFIYKTSNNGILKNANDEVVESGHGYECSGNSVTYVVGFQNEDKGNGNVQISAVKVIYTGTGEFEPLPQPEPEETETKITVPNSKTVYVGASFDLEATCNVAEATIYYESEDENIASVSNTGVVTGVAPGTVKVYAKVTGVPGQYTDAQRYCSVTVAEVPQQEEGTWSEFGISNIQEGEEFVIVGNGYAMTNNNGTSSAPAAVAVTVANNEITSDVTSDIVWTLTGNMNDGFTFYPKGETEKWLYCNTTAEKSSNNNMRVGTGDRKVFSMVIRDNYVYLVTKDNYVARYLCLYNNADWRGYVEASIVATDIKFYKKIVRPQ